MKLELTEQEANQLVNLLDVAVKAGGLQAASPALALVIKLQNASKQTQEDEKAKPRLVEAQEAKSA